MGVLLQDAIPFVIDNERQILFAPREEDSHSVESESIAQPLLQSDTVTTLKPVIEQL